MRGFELWLKMYIIKTKDMIAQAIRNNNPHDHLIAKCMFAENLLNEYKYKKLVKNERGTIHVKNSFQNR